MKDACQDGWSTNISYFLCWEPFLGVVLDKYAKHRHALEVFGHLVCQYIKIIYENTILQAWIVFNYVSKVPKQ